MEITTPEGTWIEPFYEPEIMVLEPLPHPFRAALATGPFYGVLPPAFPGVAAAHGHSVVYHSQLFAQLYALEQEALGLRALMNSCMPINRLPVELLIEIFLYVQAANVQYYPWHAVLSVCRHWFVVGSNTPQLWRHLLVAGSTNFLRTGLARSRALEVDLELLPTGAHLFDIAMTLAVPHARRLRTLKLGPQPPDRILRLITFMTGNCLPVLRTLEIEAEKVDPDEHSKLLLPLSPERFPALQQLKLTRMHIFNCPVSAFSRVTALNLSNITRHSPPFTLAALLRMLRGLENIEKLTLMYLHIPDMTTDPPPATAEDRATLSKLREIHLDLPSPAIKRILREIVIPDTASVDIHLQRVENNAEGQHSIRDMLPEDIEITLPFLSVTKEVRVVDLPWDQSFQCHVPFSDPDDPSATVDHINMTVADLSGFNDNRVPLTPNFMKQLEILRVAPLETLFIESAPSTIGSACWQTVLAPFPALRELMVVVTGHGPTPDAGRLIDALNPGLHGGEAPDIGGVLCPCLETVKFLGSIGDEGTLLPRVVACLEHRRQKLGLQKALKEMWLDLVARDEEAFAHTQATFEEALAPLVARFVCSVYDDEYTDADDDSDEDEEDDGGEDEDGESEGENVGVDDVWY